MKKAIKVIDETIKISNKKGNGILKFLLQKDSKGNVTKYSFAYINLNLCRTDNGRVLGYDNCHGYHHKHSMGTEENFKFINYEDIEKKFEHEWRKIHEKAFKEKKH